MAIQANISLLQDNAGTPGSELTSLTLNTGDTFFVEIQLGDFRADASGLIGAQLDLAWTADLFNALSFDLTDSFAFAIPGRYGDLDTDGLADNLAAAAIPPANLGQPIGDNAFERFAVVQLEVEADNTAITPALFTLEDIDSPNFAFADGASVAVTAVDDSFTIVESNLLTGDLFANDALGGGGELTSVNGASANIGQTITLTSGSILIVNADGTFTYSPAEGLATDTFTYSISVFGDGLQPAAPEDEATVTITINPVPATAVGSISDTNADANTIAENAFNGDVVGITASATDPDAGDTVTYTLTDNAGGLFAIAADTGIVTIADASLLDFETATSHNITVEAESFDGSISTRIFTIAVSDVNEAPTVALTRRVTTIAENTTTRTKVADITITDDALGTEAITLSGADAALFEVSGTELYLKAGQVVDFETNPQLDVTVSVIDDALAGSTPVTANLTIAVSDVNEAPVIVAPTNFDVEFSENSTAVVLDIDTTDPENDAITFALVGVDADLFAISAQGQITFNQTPNFEAPADNGGNNVYNIEVEVSDGTDTVTQAVTVTVTDVNEAPTAVTLTKTVPTLAEDADTAVRIKVANINVTDDAQGTETITLSGDDAALFEVVGTELYLKADAALNFETNPQLDVTVSVIDEALSGSTPVTANLTIAVTDVDGELELNFDPAEDDTIESGLIFNPNLDGNVILDTSDRSGASRQVTNGTDAVFDNLVGLYEVLDANGSVLDTDGITVLAPGSNGYALAALNARVENFTLRAGANLKTAERIEQEGDVLLNGGSFYAPFVIANGGAIGVEDFIAREDVENFNNAATTLNDTVAYFSFIEANPDEFAHLKSYGNGVFGFEDLPGNLLSSNGLAGDGDFNDAVFAFNLTA